MNYPVTTPFGQVAGYPLNNGFHNGIDYGYPMGTPVIVNGVTIGISNNTGATTGPHLHVGKFVNGVVQDPGVGNGFQFNSAVVYDTGEDATNGIFVRLTADGALWNYLHLQEVLVTKGQILGEEMTKEQAQELSLYARLMDFESVDEANSHSVDDVNHILADPGYAGALLKQLYQGSNWQDANNKKVAYEKGETGTVLRPGTYQVN